jgi:hypothetical protein
LSELLNEVAGERVQVEVSAERVLFELLGFLLRQTSAFSYQLSVQAKSLCWPPLVPTFRYNVAALACLS